jgi:linoleoyl-CoA desaturase
MEQLKRVKFVNKEKTQFLKTLKTRVDQYFIDNKIEKTANTKMKFKSFVMLSMYLVPIISIYLFHPLPTWILMICYIVSGFGAAGVGMSVMHDSIHGAYSENKWVNKILGLSLNFIGGYDVNWKLQHNILHHTYTNITNLDEDISQRLKMRWSPHFKFHPAQRFQHIYAFLAYCLATLSWVFIKDFKQFYNYSQNGVNKGTKNQKALDLLKLIISKVVYWIYMLIIPIGFLGYAPGIIITGFLIMHAITGFVLSTIFQLAHVVEHAEFPLPNDAGNIENEWAIHQLQTTADFGHDSKLLTWYTGGLTHQIEHHIFPDICHIHYPKIAPIVEETAKEYGIIYNNNPTYFGALKSHYRILKKFGLPNGKFDLANA